MGPGGDKVVGPATTGAVPRVEQGIGPAVGRANRALREAWEEQISDLGLSAPQALVLRLVHEQPGCGLRELARRARTDAMNARRVTEHLVANGLVISQAGPGHRQRRSLRTTPQGTALAEEVARRAAAWDSHLAVLLGRSGTERLQAVLSRLDRVLSSLPHGPAPARAFSADGVVPPDHEPRAPRGSDDRGP